MNVAEYGGSLQRIALDNMQRLADIENRRYWNNVEMDQVNQEFRDATIGGLAGTIAGMGKGLYESRKAKHDAKNAADLETWRDDRQTRILGNMQAGRPLDDGLPSRPTATDYRAWDDLMGGLRDMGWVD